MATPDSQHGPIEARYRAAMKDLCKSIDLYLNTNGERENGFVLLVFPFGGEPGRRVNYMSNGRREDMIKAMREWLDRVEASAV
jgi:hypothetical protein